MRMCGVLVGDFPRRIGEPVDSPFANIPFTSKNRHKLRLSHSGREAPDHELLAFIVRLSFGRLRGIALSRILLAR